MTIYSGDPTDTSDEYATKPALWRPIEAAVGGFDLDPASGAEEDSIAADCYTAADDGLARPWYGTVWLNPPFSEKPPWYRKVVTEVQAGNADLVVALAPGDTSTDWFQTWFAQADLLCWLDGRRWYLADGSPSFNTVVGVFGDYPAELGEVLETRGVCTRAIDPTGPTQTTLTGGSDT